MLVVISILLFIIFFFFLNGKRNILTFRATVQGIYLYSSIDYSLQLNFERSSNKIWKECGSLITWNFITLNLAWRPKFDGFDEVNWCTPLYGIFNEDHPNTCSSNPRTFALWTIELWTLELSLLGPLHLDP